MKKFVNIVIGLTLSLIPCTTEVIAGPQTGSPVQKASNNSDGDLDNVHINKGKKTSSTTNDEITKNSGSIKYETVVVLSKSAITNRTKNNGESTSTGKNNAKSETIENNGQNTTTSKILTCGDDVKQNNSCTAGNLRKWVGPMMISSNTTTYRYQFCCRLGYQDDEIELTEEQYEAMDEATGYNSNSSQNSLSDIIDAISCAITDIDSTCAADTQDFANSMYSECIRQFDSGSLEGFSELFATSDIETNCCEGAGCEVENGGCTCTADSQKESDEMAEQAKSCIAEQTAAVSSLDPESYCGTAASEMQSQAMSECRESWEQRCQ